MRNSLLILVLSTLVACSCATAPKTKPNTWPTNFQDAKSKAVQPSKTLGVSVQALAQADTRMGTVTLGWTASPTPTVVGYKIYRGGSPGSYTNAVDVGNVTRVEMADAIPGATYYYVATAYDSSGRESEKSNEVSASIPIPPPLPPGNLNVIGIQVASNPAGPWQELSPPVTFTNLAGGQFFKLEITRK